MGKRLDDAYRDFLKLKIEKRGAGALWDRIPHKLKPRAFEAVLEVILEVKSPEDDAEFMDRVGNDVAGAEARME